MSEQTRLAIRHGFRIESRVGAMLKKLSGGRVTTVDGGRPVIPEKRRATQMEVVRLRGEQRLSFRKIGFRLGISDRQAQILWIQYWDPSPSKKGPPAGRIRGIWRNPDYVALPTGSSQDRRVTTPRGGRPFSPGKRKALQTEVLRLRNSGLPFQKIGAHLGISDRHAKNLWDEYWNVEWALADQSARYIRSSLTASYLRIQDLAIGQISALRVPSGPDDAAPDTVSMADFVRFEKMSRVIVRISAQLSVLLGLGKPLRGCSIGGRNLTDYLASLESP